MIMPKMGDAMEEGTLLKWLKSEGDEVSEGDPIVEIETDKVTLELEAEDAGTLAKLYASEGDEIPIGEAIAFIAGEGEEAPESSGGAASADSGGESEGEAEQEEGGSDEGGDSGGSRATVTLSDGGAEDSSGGTDEGEASAESNGQYRASPIVKRLARENDLDLGKIKGSGPAGRIVERDVKQAMEDGSAKSGGDSSGEAPAQEQKSDSDAKQASAGTPKSEAPKPTGEDGTELKPLTKMQKVVATRMSQSKQEVPHFYVSVEAEVDALMALRKQLNSSLEEDGVKLSVNDFVMKACATGLKKFPNLNALWTEEGIETYEQVDMAMAVALDAGLITPVVKDAGRITLSAISAQAKDLASRARDGKLKPEEYQGGTFTVSNMGMFGIENFSAIINQPQAAIVAVASIAKRPAFDDEGNVVERSYMKLTL
ncbi:MAG: dihydrolipoamide acetyltransferase family protein, partial [Rubrobacter sp.]